MNKGFILVMLAVSLALAGCKCDKGNKSNKDGQSALATIVDVGCVNDPKLTNDEIIAETAKCEAAGLNAEPLHCGENYTTTHIQCKPREIK